MRRLLFFLLFSCLSFTTLAQVPDFLSVRRRNGRTIKTFYAGSTINFTTISGTEVSGTIHNIRNDSLYISTYAIRVVPTRLGVTMVDTFARRVERVWYKDIDRIEVYSRTRAAYRRIGSLLSIGGGGFIFLNLFNGLYLAESITEKANLKRIGTAASVGAAGVLIRMLNKKNTFSRKRHRIVYINLQPTKAF